MHAEKNITKNDMRFFQNDMLIDLKKLELQINSKLSTINQTLSSKTNEYDLKFTKIFELIPELISKVAARKYDNDRIEELLSIKHRFSEQIMENHTRLSMIDKNLEDSIFKYDKMIIDNLQVPGIIGKGCTFKNCRLFFENVYNELKLNQKNKEQEQSLLKVFQEKMENKIFRIENELNKIHQNVNQICEGKFEKYFAKFEERLKITEEIIHSSRIENSKYAEELIKASTSLQIEWEKLENIKNEIDEKFNEELDTFKKLVDSANRNYYNQENEFKIFKKKFAQYSEYLKDFKNQYKEIAKNIDLLKKEKANNNYIENFNRKVSAPQNFIKSPSPIKNRGKYNLNEGENKNVKDSFVSVTNSKKEVENSPKPNPKLRRNSMFNEEKIKNPAFQMIKKNKIPEKRISNINVRANIFKNNNINIKTMTEIKNKRENKDEKKIFNEMMLKTEKKFPAKKKFLKIIKKQKTIVTENDIDLNFESKKKMRKIKEKNISKEESNDDEEEEDEELLSVDSNSSEFSLSSVISLHNMKKQSRKNEKISEANKEEEEEEEKGNNNIEKKDDKEKLENKEKFKNKEKINNKEKIYNEIKVENKEKIEKIENKENKEKEYYRKKENIKDKKENIDIMDKREKINSKEKINNNEKSISIEKTNSKEKTTKEKDKIEKKIISKDNLNDNKFNRTVSNLPKIKNKSINAKNNNANNKINNNNTLVSEYKQISKKGIENENKRNINIIKNSKINLHKNIQNSYFSDNCENNNQVNESVKQFSLVENNEDKNKINNDEIQNEKDEQTIKKLQSISILDDKKSLQIIDYKNNLKKNDNIRLDTEVTFPQIKTFSDELSIRDNFKSTKNALQQTSISYMITKPNDFGRNIGQKLKRNQLNFNNILNKKSNSKEENQKNKNNLAPSKNINNNINEDKDKEPIKTNNLFNVIDIAKREIQKMNSNNIENINNDAFLTSLNNINNNYNYYYNNTDNNNIISSLNNKNKINDEIIDKFNNKIGFINGNIKSANNRINTLEDRYKDILNQLNNIFKIVSSFYHHKRKSRRSTKKEKTILQKKEDLYKNTKFMNKIRELYNDNEYNLKIPSDGFNRTLKTIEPFLIKKFKNNNLK